MNSEIWKDIPGYENIYQASDLGRIKSLGRTIDNNRGSLTRLKERILKPGKIKGGYTIVILSGKGIAVHQLVAMAFLNHKPCGFKLVVDHINNTTCDNRLENLQILSHRSNINKSKSLGKSKYRGVCWSIKNKKWRARIQVNGKNLFLGLFDCEIEAGKVYSNKLKELENGFQ